MRFYSMLFPIALCLGLLAANSFAELTVTRQPPRDGSGNYTFTCVSEDDRSALVWNRDLRVSPLQHDDEFLPIRPSSDFDCAITGGAGCIAKWTNKESWYAVHSVDQPMGPVFDSRWENFTDRSFRLGKDSQGEYEHIIEVPGSGAVVFSVRGLAGVNLRLCEQKNLMWEPGLCFTITIAASPDGRSKIHSSYETVTQGYTMPAGSIVHESEWRTFTLEWNEKLKKVHVYNDAGFYLLENFDPWINVKHLFIRSDSAGYIRFHFYDYLGTKTNNAELISSRIDYTRNNYCMELLVGLCAQCQLEVAVVYPNLDTQYITTISWSRPLYGKLPTWKIVTINATLPYEKDSYFKLKLVTKLNHTAVDGLWAIDSIRPCKSSDDVRTSTITVPGSLTAASASSPKIGCQRLRYDSHSTVNSQVRATDKLANGLSKCNRGKLGPCCTLARNVACDGSTICQSSGCSCAPGFTGDDCTDYDLNDEEIDRFCQPGTYDFHTGSCDGRCISDYLPPSCTTELKEPRATNVTATTARVDFWILGNAKELSVEYVLEALRSGGVYTRTVETRNYPRIPLVHYTLHLSGLSAFTTYTLRASVETAKGLSWKFPDIHFTTLCTGDSDHEHEKTGGKQILPSEPTGSVGGTDQKNLLWLLVLLIPLISFGLCFFWRRKVQNIHERMKTPAVDGGDNISLATICSTPSLDWPFDSCPHPVKLKKFEESVKRSVENGELESQFTILPRGLMQPCQYGSLQANRHKNKYKHIVAYDETRVILTTDSPGPQDDYINANYIRGYCKDKAYIATQGPRSETLVDFWRMIWQEEVRIICMMVNVVEGGKKMCEQYWPEIGKTVKHGGTAIINIKQRVYAHYTYRTFQLTKDHETESRKVEHLQYTGWPEQGVPMYCHSIVEYLNELRATPSGPGPIVVHCNAGVGRTGTLILSDICLDYTAAEGTVDLFAEAKKMFHARANMLDNLQQYILAHLMPTQCLLLLPTKLPCSDVSLDTIEKLKEDLTIHIRRLAVSSWKDKALYPSEPLKLPNLDHMAKNRFPAFIPVEHSLVSLNQYPPGESDSEYISAVSVDGVESKGLYLASQLPLASTLPDLWRLVAEKRVELIVILQRPGPEGLDCVDVVPQETHFYPVPYITVENTMCSDYQPHFTSDKLLLVDTLENEAVLQNVTVITCNNWGLAEDSEPPPPEALVALWSASERVSRTDQGPTLVLCHDGVTGCGLYLALSIVLQRMAVEQECDVILAARVVRRSRPDFVCSQKQFEYLYDAALEFMQTFKNYDNFA